MRYFLHLAYKGTRYKGWQRQPNAPSIQETLEDCLSRMFKSRIICIGCGRTDAGVHASQYFAHFNHSGELDFDPVFRLNQMLPPDIVVFEMIPVSPFTHAQYDVISRTYDYFVHSSRHPFLYDLSSYYPLVQPDWNKMEQACRLIGQQSDFRYFCRSPESYDSTQCKIFEVTLRQNDAADRFCFRISADRFLRGMVRMIAAALLEIGAGRMSFIDFEEAVSAEKPLPYPKAAHPQGLHLAAVKYPYLEIPSANSFSGLV